MRILIITSYLIKSSINSKKALALYILLPLTCLLLPIFVFNSPERNDRRINLSIIDLDNSNESIALVNHLKNEHNFNTFSTDLASSKENLIFDKTCSTLIIPKNFQMDLFNKKSPKVALVYLKLSEEIPIIKNIINSYIANLNLLTYSDNLNFSPHSKNTIKLINVDTNQVPKSNNLVYSSLGLIILFMMILTNTSFSGFLRDKDTKVLNRILRTGLTPSDYLFSYILFCVFICFFQGVIFVIFLNLFNANIEISLMKILFIFSLISIVAISFGTLSTALCKTEEEVAILNAVIVFPTCMLSGCLWPIEIMNTFFQKLSRVFPQRHILIIIDFIQNKVKFSAILFETVLILLMCLLCIILSFAKINSKGWNGSL